LKKIFYQGIFWRGLNYITVFIVTIVIARLFKPGESGSINYLVNNLAILILLTSFGLESALGYFSAKDHLLRPALVGTSLMMVVFSTVLNMLMIRWVIVPHDPAAWIPCISYCAGVILMNYFSGLFFSQYNYILPNIVVMLVNTGIIAVATWAPLSFSGENANRFLPFYFGSFLVAGCVTAAGYLLRYGIRLSWPSWQIIMRVFRYAAMALVTNLVFFLVYRADYWFVHRNCTPGELGNYIQVSKLGQLFLLLPGIIAGVLFTHSAGSNQQGHVRLLQALSRLLIIFYGLCLAVIVITGKWLFPFVYGAEFDMMYVPFLLLVPGILSLSTLSLVTAFNAGQNRIRMNLTGAVIALTVILAGNLIFSKQYGIYAASLVSSAGYICYQVYVMVCIRPYIEGYRIRDFFVPVPGDLHLIKNLLKRNEQA
jgi:O-antigen/teichoic acid export membrane protein